VACARVHQDAEVGRLALHVPVVAGEPKRTLRIVLDDETKARLLATMHRVAARARGVEARRELGAMLA
jgi:hypothetical protein